EVSARHGLLVDGHPRRSSRVRVAHRGFDDCCHPSCDYITDSSDSPGCDVKSLSLATQPAVISRDALCPAAHHRSPKKSLLRLNYSACGARKLIAAVRHSISSSSLNGLLKKPTAPLSSARFRCFSFGKAVIRITGIWCPCDSNASCNSS